MESNNRLRSAHSKGDNRLHKRRHLYVADTDQGIWTEAEKWCKDQGISLSSLVATALDEYLKTHIVDLDYIKALGGEI